MLPTADTFQVILPIVSFVFLVLGFYRNIYGVIGYFIIMGTRMGLLFPGLGQIRIELVAAIIVFLSMFLKGGTITRIVHQRNIIHKYVIILTIICLFSTFFAVNISVSWGLGYLEYLKVFFFYLMIVGSIQKASDLKLFIWSFILITIWIGYEPVANYFAGIVVVERTYGAAAIGSVGFAAGHVGLANTLCQGMPMTYFWFKFQKSRVMKSILFLALGFLITGVVLSKSRGGFLGMLAVASGTIYFAESRKKAAIMVVFVFILLIPFVGNNYWDHISSISSGIFGSRSSSDRYLGLVHGIEILFKRPILGAGIGCYAEARSMYFGYNFYSHNLYGELFGELGIASVVWFLWIYHIFKRSISLKRVLNAHNKYSVLYSDVLNAVQVGLFVRLVIGNFSHCAFIWFWFVMAGLVVALEYVMKRDEDTNGALSTVNCK